MGEGKKIGRKRTAKQNFQIGKRGDKSCKALFKKLNHLQIGTYFIDDWKPYKKYIPEEKYFISKRKTTPSERRNRDFKTHLKRLCRETVCFYKKDDLLYGSIKTYIKHINAT